MSAAEEREVWNRKPEEDDENDAPDNENHSGYQAANAATPVTVSPSFAFFATASILLKS